MTDDVHVSERTTVDHQPSTWRGTPLEDWVYGVGVLGGTVFITLLVFISGSDIGRAFLSGITSFVGFAVVLLVPWGIARAIRGTGSA